MFDLRAIVNKTLSSYTGIARARDLADQILADIPDEHLREALNVTLPIFVRHQIGMNRNIPSGEIRTDTITSIPNPYADTKPRRSGQRNSAHSSHVKAIREWWLDQIEVSVAGGGYLHLGECTFDDLMFAAEDRRQRALSYMHAAERFEKIADAVKEHGVDIVAELPAKVRAELTPLFERT